MKRSGADIKKSAPNVIGVGPNGHSLLTERLMPIPIRRHDEMSKDTQLSDWRYIV